MSRSWMKSCLVLVIFLLLILGSSMSEKGLKLIINAAGTSHVFPVTTDDQLVIRYIHSIHHSPVEEIFSLHCNKVFSLVTATYEDLGWGGPDRATLQEIGQPFYSTGVRSDEGSLSLVDIQYRFIPLNQPEIWLNQTKLNVDNLNQGGLIYILLQE